MLCLFRFIVVLHVSEPRLQCTRIPMPFFLLLAKRFVKLVRNQSYLAAGMTPTVVRFPHTTTQWSSVVRTSLHGSE